MSVFEVVCNEVYPVYWLKETDRPPGVEDPKRWSRQVRIQLTDAEYADWRRVNAEYEAWDDRIAAMYSAALDAAGVK